MADLRRHLALTLLLLGLPKVGAALDDTTDPALHAYLLRAMADQHFSGSVLVARDGSIVHARGYGPASSTADNRAGTAFHVASVSKQFTAAAIMQLVEAGDIDLQATINNYLPNRYRAPGWDAVTVHHLLSHSGGIPDYAVSRDYYDVVDGFCLGDTVDGMVREAMSKPLEFTPGSQYEYSNIGFTLLGFIIEAVTGETYEGYLERAILRPMGMTSSRVHVEGHVAADNEADGLRWSDEDGVHVPDDIVSLPVTAPDGGLVTTLRDFLTWSTIYAGGEQDILSQDSIATMITPQVAIGRGGPLDNYGYGLYVGDRLIGHAGYIVGFRSQFILDRETNTLIAVFSNNVTNNPTDIAFELLTLFFEDQ